MGIVHFGVGAFHRAHQAMYVDRLLHADICDWGICGVGVLRPTSGIRDVLGSQDGLYTLLTVDPGRSRRPGSSAPTSRTCTRRTTRRRSLDRLADPATRIVSLTITEGGYGVNDATGGFEPRDPATLADLAGAATTDQRARPDRRRARRPPGRRHRAVHRDVLRQHPGQRARDAQDGRHGLRAAQRDPALADWIAAEVAFPNSMVDRITPATTDETRAAVAALGVDDAWPVRSESFTQWVLEDRFSAGRPAFETVGVQLVATSPPYELMKLRLLNASHQAMSYLGILAGETYVHDVCRDPLFVRFLLDYMHREAIPTLPECRASTWTAYCDQLIARFSSEAIRDTLARQVVDASDRIPKFLLPVLREQLRRRRRDPPLRARAGRVVPLPRGDHRCRDTLESGGQVSRRAPVGSSRRDRHSRGIPGIRQSLWGSRG